MAFWLSGSGRTQNKQLAIWLENIILGLHGEVNCSALKNCREVPHPGESGMPPGHQGAGEAPGNLEATTRGAERSGPTESAVRLGATRCQVLARLGTDQEGRASMVGSRLWCVSIGTCCSLMCARARTASERNPQTAGSGGLRTGSGCATRG